MDVVESGDPQGRSSHLIDDLELHAALLARGAGADDRPQSPRDPSLPDVSPTTLMFFAAGSLVIFVVSLMVLMH